MARFERRPAPARRRLLQELRLHQAELEAQNRELKEVLVRLEASQARYAELYDTAPLGCCTLDERGVLRELNATGARMLGAPREVLLGLPLAPAAGLPVAEVLALLRAAQAGPALAEAELRPPRGLPQAVQLVAVAAEGGGFRVALTDVGARRAAERERDRLLIAEQKARARAEAAGLAKDSFLARAAHELGTPLTAMTFWLHLAREAAPDEREAALGVLEGCVHAAVALVEDLTDLARGQAGKLRLSLAPVELWPEVEAAIEALRPRAEARGVRLELGPDPGRVWGDPARLRQIATNLVSNALRHTPPGGAVRVSVGAAPEGVRLLVRDTGLGLAAEALERVFDPSWQEGDPLAGEHPGLGLGLAIVRELVTAQGGQVHAESDGPGQGATFVVHLRPAPGPALSPAPAPTAAGLAGARVLLVEDDEATRLGVARLLEGAGAVVTCAGTAAEARAALARRAPDLVLLDLALPGGGGLALLEELRGEAVPVVSYSALARPGLEAEALAAGAQAHLAKPVGPGALLACLAQVLGGAGSANKRS